MRGHRTSLDGARRAATAFEETLARADFARAEDRPRAQERSFPIPPIAVTCTAARTARRRDPHPDGRVP
ncbi:hypothetical protein [Streptomyces sp. NPDC059828]|uniref:hypothetical protein n=1 Tax=Streptomyces sp. NPDC059828 TaxID=3346965 RepID=UPI00365EF4FE